MTTANAEFSPQAYARTAGFLYLIVIVGGGFAELFVRQRLVVINDAAATAQDILAPGIASSVFALLMISGLAEVALCLWLLLKGVNVAKWQESRASTSRTISAPTSR